MTHKTISIQSPESIKIALSALNTGNVLVIPTDTVYGLACLASSQSAIERIYKIKGRDFSKALPVLISDISQLTGVADNLSDAAKKIMTHFWPGAITLVVQKHPSLSPSLTILPTVGVRMPDHTWLLDLIKMSGPLAATSANLSGFKSPVDVKEVLKQLRGKVDYLFDGGPCKGGIASTVVDCSGPEPRILREGQITFKQIDKVLIS